MRASPASSSSVIKPRRWTLRRLRSRLRALVVSQNVFITVRRLDSTDCSAEAYWKEEGGDVFITVDHDQEGRVTCVIHELLHFLLAKDLNGHFSGEVEEHMIQGLERGCFEWVRSDKKRFEWWRRAISAKLDDDSEN